MIQQIEFQLPAMRRGCHLITDEITRLLTNPLPKYGLLNVFVKHTSCGLTINENADPDVRMDMDNILDNIVPENEPYYNHTMEGADDCISGHGTESISVSSVIIAGNEASCLAYTVDGVLHRFPN